MPLTVDEIQAHERILEKEIAEKQALLSTYQRLRAQTAGKDTASPPSAAPPIPDASQTTSQLETPPPAQPDVHPDLAAISQRGGSRGDYVLWAVQRMTGDYSLNEIMAALNQGGIRIAPSEISVALTRLRKRGQIEQIRPGAGRTPAFYRKPASANVETQVASESTSHFPSAAAENRAE